MERSLYDVLLKAFELQGYKIEDIKDIAIVDNLINKNDDFEKRIKQISKNCTQQIGYFKRYNTEIFLNICKIIPFDANELCVGQDLTIYMKDGNFFQYIANNNYMVFFDTIQTNNNVASKQQTTNDCFYFSSIIHNEYCNKTFKDKPLNDGIIFLIKCYFYKIFDKKDDDVLLTGRYILFPCYDKFYLKYNHDLYSFENKGDDCYYALKLKKNNNLKTNNMICIDLDEK